MIVKFANQKSKLAALLLLLCCGLISPLAAYDAFGKPFRGELEWRYADYSSRSSAGADFEGSHFAQRYALMYNVAGEIYNRVRGGVYNLGLGGEWWGLDTTYGDEEISLSKFKLLYQGEILFAPAGLPVRMHLFAYDKQSPVFVQGSSFDSVIDPGIITDVYDGTSEVIGGTVVAGIRNGSYLGKHRETLSSLPRLFIDFRQTTAKDDESRTPQHYRDRRLAFVSLNKKDNWFHYRLNQHEDFIDDNNGFIEKTVMLGTVDHMLYRQWIWLTNWLKLSTDGSFTTVEETNGRDADKEELYAYNLFLAGRTAGLSFTNLNTFDRNRRGSRLENHLSLPLYLTYAIDPDRQFRGQFIFARDQYEDQAAVDYGTNMDNVYFSGKLETGLIQPVRIDPSLEMEYKGGNLGRGQNARGMVEAYTNPRYRSDLAWLLSYSLASFNGTSISDQGVSFVEQEAVLSASRVYSPALKAGVTQTLVFGSGTLDTDVSQRISPLSDAGLFGTLSNNQQVDGEVLHATTEMFVDYNQGRMSNRFMAVYDFLKVGEDTADSLLLKHRLNYRRGALGYRMTNQLTLNGDSARVNSSSSYTGYRPASGDSSDIFYEHHSFAEYLPNRNWLTKGRVDYQWSGGGSDSSSLLAVAEESKYAFFHKQGTRRRWLELFQGFNYEQSWSDVGDDRQYWKFSLGTFYSPTRNTYLRAELGHEVYDPGATVLTYGLGAGVDFPLLKLEARYNYGLSEDEDGNEVEDHRWELNVKKLI